MGVRGLTKAVLKSNAGREENLSQLAQQETVTLLIDGYALLFHVIELVDNDPLPHLAVAFCLKGFYREFEQRLRDFCEPLVTAGINVQIYFDAGRGSSLTDAGRKQAEWQKRMLDSIAELSDLEEYCGGLDPDMTEEDLGLALPFLGRQQAHKVFQDLNIFSEVCVEEADEVMMARLLEEQKSSVCFIVSGDSDFFVFPESQYIPFECLRMEHNSVCATVFTPDVVARELALAPARLLDLAALCGNDITKPITESGALQQHLGFYPSVSNVAKFLAQLDPTVDVEDTPQFKAAAKAMPELVGLFGLSRQFYLLQTYRSGEAEKAATAGSLSGSDYGYVAREVRTETLPSYCLAVLVGNEHWCAVFREPVNATAIVLGDRGMARVGDATSSPYVSIGSLLRKMRACFYRMLGRDTVLERTRNGLQLFDVPVKAADVKSTAGIGSVAQLEQLRDKRPLVERCAAAQTILNFAFSSATPFQLKAESLDWRPTLVQALAATGLDGGTVLTYEDVLVVAAMLSLGSFERDRLRQVFASSLQSRPSMHCVYVAALFQALIKHVHDLCLFVGLEFLLSPMELFDDEVFVILFDLVQDQLGRQESPESALPDLLAQHDCTMPRLPSLLSLKALQGLQRAAIHDLTWNPSSDPPTEPVLDPGLDRVMSDALPTPELLPPHQTDVQSPPDDPMTALASLPVMSHREEIIEAVASHRVVVIEGETGCGKSSGVPVCLLQDAMEKKANIKVLVTQPRRIAATSLARRVADVYGETIGQTVGYWVSMDKLASRRTKIVYATVGFVLQAFTHDSDRMKQFTHIVLDEVHERSMENDMLLLLLHLTLKDYPHLKIIIMSATLQNDIFQDYFSFADPKGVPTLFVGSRRFPVQEMMLDDFTNDFVGNERKVAQRLRLRFDKMAVNTYTKAELIPEAEAIGIALIHKIRRPGECILVFLPGYAEILNMFEKIEALENTEVYLLHSQIQLEDPEAVFRPPAEGNCKVVLATNVAESSITIPDVINVIDFGLQRGIRVDEKRKISVLGLSFCSKAACAQRSGRAGRVQPGVCYRIFSRSFFEQKMPRFDQAEMLRLSLDKVVLNTILLMSHFGLTVHELLATAIDPPGNERVDHAITSLRQCGALVGDDLQVSDFGEIAAHLPTDMSLARLLAIGMTVGSACDALILVAAMSSQDVFFQPAMFDDRVDVHDFSAKLVENVAFRVKYDAGFCSEPLGARNVFLRWLRSDRTKYWCIKNSLSFVRMKALSQSVHHFSRCLLEAGNMSATQRGYVEDLMRFARSEKPTVDQLAMCCSSSLEKLYFMMCSSLWKNALFASTATLKKAIKRAHKHNLKLADVMCMARLNNVPRELRDPKDLQQSLTSLGLNVHSITLVKAETLVRLAAPTAEAEAEAEVDADADDDDQQDGKAAGSALLPPGVSLPDVSSAPGARTAKNTKPAKPRRDLLPMMVKMAPEEPVLSMLTPQAMALTMMSSGWIKLRLPNPNYKEPIPGQGDDAQAQSPRIVETQPAQPISNILWLCLADGATARLNWRSVACAALPPEDETSPLAVAHSIIGTDTPSQVRAQGITVLPKVLGVMSALCFSRGEVEIVGSCEVGLFYGVNVGQCSVELPENKFFTWQDLSAVNQVRRSLNKDLKHPGDADPQRQSFVFELFQNLVKTVESMEDRTIGDIYSDPEHPRNVNTVLPLAMEPPPQGMDEADVLFPLYNLPRGALPLETVNKKRAKKEKKEKQKKSREGEDGRDSGVARSEASGTGDDAAKKQKKKAKKAADLANGPAAAAEPAKPVKKPPKVKKTTAAAATAAAAGPSKKDAKKKDAKKGQKPGGEKKQKKTGNKNPKHHRPDDDFSV